MVTGWAVDPSTRYRYGTDAAFPIGIQIDAPPPSRRNWGVTMRVEKVKRGRYAESEFTFAIHSPARSGLEVGHRYTIEANWDGHEYLVDETVLMKEEPSKP